MAEWSNAAVLKTVDLLPRIRGFESLFLRSPNYSPGFVGGFLFYRWPSQACLREDICKIKSPYEWNEYGSNLGCKVLPQVITEGNPSFSAVQSTPAACCGIFVFRHRARLAWARTYSSHGLLYLLWPLLVLLVLHPGQINQCSVKRSSSSLQLLSCDKNVQNRLGQMEVCIENILHRKRAASKDFQNISL